MPEVDPVTTAVLPLRLMTFLLRDLPAGAVLYASCRKAAGLPMTPVVGPRAEDMAPAPLQNDDHEAFCRAEDATSRRDLSLSPRFFSVGRGNIHGKYPFSRSSACRSSSRPEASWT